MDPYQYFGALLDVAPKTLEGVDRVMAERTGRSGVLAGLMEENERRAREALEKLSAGSASFALARTALRDAILAHERELISIVTAEGGTTEFERAARFAKRIARVGRGFFLKRDYAYEILKKSNPANLVKYLKCKTVKEVLEKVDVLEAFSALRFVETNEWMHSTFEKAYSGFTAKDFEERDIEIKVLGDEWEEIARKFVAKKHHNVSHLKEFGVVFLNPIKEDVPGKFLRDFALLLHYFYEIEFYSKLFERYSHRENFAENLKALLRGDVKEVKRVKEGEWLIIQRYLFKEDPKDPRLSLPHVNPESMHWFRGERDLARFGSSEAASDLELWGGLDWVGKMFHGDDGELLSFDLEDNAMSAVSFAEGNDIPFSYHQREALWTKLFSEYAGGEAHMESLLIENFDKGVVRF